MTSWQPNDPDAIRQALALPATVPCLDAIGRAMADLERRHPAGVLSARALLDAVALIDQQLLAGGPEQEQAIEQQSSSGPIAGSVAAAGDGEPAPFFEWAAQTQCCTLRPHAPAAVCQCPAAA